MAILNRALPGLLDQPIVQIELVLLLLLPFLARFVPFERLEAAARCWMRRPALALSMVALATLLLHAALNLREPLRQPFAHDEFSFLLQADTYLSGRLANPPHPLWPSFETPHVISAPTYASMYPPGQGLLLAAGSLFGHPLFGAWIGGAALGALAGWMLLAWVPRPWALCGAVLVALRYGLFSYWATGYWGGIPAGLGGLLVLGSAPRLLRTGRAVHGVWIAAGLMLLAISRPFEGALFALSCLAVCWPQLPAIRRLRWRALWPGTLVLLAGAAFAGYYNYRVTGSPLRLGYQINMERYGMAVFPWQSSVPQAQPAAAHLRKFYDSQRDIHTGAFSTATGVIASKIIAFGRFWAFFLGPLLTLPFIVGLLEVRWPCRVAFLLFIAGLGLNGWFFPHYFAPALGILLVLLIDGLRRIAAGTAWSRRFAWAIPISLCLMAVFRLAAGPLHAPPLREAFELGWYVPPPSIWDRAGVQRALEQRPGKHLVLVRYDEDVSIHTEWVYNRAGIDAARVVWAHDLDADSNRRLLSYYPDRVVWRLHVTAQGARLRSPGS